MKKKIVVVLILFLLGSFLVPVVAMQSNLVESHRSGIPETLDIGKEVSIRITLDEVSSDLTTNTNLTFKTGLEDPVWAFTMKGMEETETEGNSSSKVGLIFDHGKYDNLTISLSGLASSHEKKIEILLMSIKQTDETDEQHEVIKSIRREVTTEDIEGVLAALDRAKGAINEANESIANAEANGTNIGGEIKTHFDLANWHLREANRLYSASKTEESLVSANNAYNNATIASELASSKVIGDKEHQEFIGQMKHVVILIVCIVAVIAVVILYKRSSWDKLG